ncbi:hypothetical protein M0812_23735 [Anaeramoeba flamelloides]|uniref:Uncharacterized protein n=1 Tax=Anaeramoeba flamelloides TaxID=1746091 RepID=A0AAV7YQ94_9EUKA|nr:hypothetical protein M0812_23735 [Anaeramoeba flamelloides]
MNSIQRKSQRTISQTNVQNNIFEELSQNYNFQRDSDDSFFDTETDSDTYLDSNTDIDSDHNSSKKKNYQTKKIKVENLKTLSKTKIWIKLGEERIETNWKIKEKTLKEELFENKLRKINPRSRKRKKKINEKEIEIEKEDETVNENEIALEKERVIKKIMDKKFQDLIKMQNQSASRKSKCLLPKNSSIKVCFFSLFDDEVIKFLLKINKAKNLTKSKLFNYFLIIEKTIISRRHELRHHWSTKPDLENLSIKKIM